MLKKQVFLTMAVFWICVLSINLCRPFVSDNYVVRNSLLLEKISWKNRFDIVVTGDSRTLTGVSPLAMENILPGEKIANLGFIALIYSQEYMNYVRESLSEPVKNKIIVLCFTPRSLVTNQKEECYFRIYNKEARNLLRVDINSYFKRLSSLFRELSEDDMKNHFKEGDIRYLSFCFDTGWVASRLYPEDPNDQKAQYKLLFLGDKYDEKVLEMIFRNVKKWTGEGIIVAGVRLPTSPSIKIVEDKFSGLDMQKVQSKFEENGGIWLNPRSSFFVSYDGSHARYDSAVIYSKDLANELKELISVKNK